jgi:hypothetical protein
MTRTPVGPSKGPRRSVLGIGRGRLTPVSAVLRVLCGHDEPKPPKWARRSRRGSACDLGATSCPENAPLSTGSWPRNACKSECASAGRDPLLTRGSAQATERARFASLSSPLTDSNRRPPPYHPGTKSGSAGTPGVTAAMQTRGIRRIDVTRAWTRMDRLMFAYRSRGSLTVSATISDLARAESKHQQHRRR